MSKNADADGDTDVAVNDNVVDEEVVDAVEDGKLGAAAILKYLGMA